MAVKAIITLSFLVLASFSMQLKASDVQTLEFTQTYKPFNECLQLEMKDEAGFADKGDLDRYFQIDSITVKEVETPEVFNQWPNQKNIFQKDLGQIIMVVDQLIALGKKIWPIIEAGRPVITTQFTPTLSVLPRTEESPDYVSMYQMDNWAAPAQRSYKVDYRNGFGAAVISFTYTVSFQYGGRYEGRGRYLTGVDVSASNISVAWGFQFDAQSSLINIANRGSVDDPIASATVRINYKASSFLSEIQSSQGFHLAGDGSLEQVF